MAAVKVPYSKRYLAAGDGYKGDIKLDGQDLSAFITARLIITPCLSVSKRKASLQILEVFQYLALSLPSSSHGLDTEINAALEEISCDVDITDKLHRSICDTVWWWMATRSLGGHVLANLADTWIYIREAVDSFDEPAACWYCSRSLTYKLIAAAEKGIVLWSWQITILTEL